MGKRTGSLEFMRDDALGEDGVIVISGSISLTRSWMSGAATNTPSHLLLSGFSWGDMLGVAIGYLLFMRAAFHVPWMKSVPNPLEQPSF
jgi:hypothetical protein